MSDKIKELFTVQYWGQKVYKPETVSDPMEVNSGDMGSGYLLLRSVEQLTDEEAINLGFLSSDNLRQCWDSYGATRFITTFIGILAYQYLISIGILLPFCYLNEENKPITIQPEEILKRGWAKYQGVCKH